MKTASCFSTSLDPYRAGAQLGETLAALEPEVIFLFASIHLDGSTELAEAIYDALGSDDAVLIGCTGDGFYEKGAVADIGVSALGINSGGLVRWRVAHESGVADAPLAATERCIATLNAACAPASPAFYFLTTDFRTDTSQIIAALQRTVSAPVVGGSAGDDSSFERCFVYVNRQVLTDSVAVLAADGPLQHELLVAHALSPMGRPAQISAVDGATVRTIDHIPAMDFIERELGKPLDAVDEGILTLMLTDGADGRGRRIRSLLLPTERSDGAGVQLFGSVRRGDWAQVCLAPSSRMLQDVREIGAAARQLPFEPLAGLVVSCAGRKRVLAADVGLEVAEIVRSCPSLEAIAGFPSFGEFGAVEIAGTGSALRFHNMTLMLLLIGAAPE